MPQEDETHAFWGEQRKRDVTRQKLAWLSQREARALGQVGLTPAHPQARPVAFLGVRVSVYLRRGVRVCVCERERERGQEWRSQPVMATTTTLSSVPHPA